MALLSSIGLGVTPIQRETVQNCIHRQLRDLLMRGRFQPGQPLKIQDMADLFGTSTQPVREAIRQLVAENALEALPNRTARVPVFNRERLEDLRRARIAIEGLAAELATARATKADIKMLESLVEVETAADDADQAELSVAQNQRFHFAFYRLSGSAVLLPIIEGLWLQIGPFIRKSAEYFDAREGRGAEHHVAALSALRRRDPARVRRAIEADINRSFDIARDAMFPCRPRGLRTLMSYGEIKGDIPDGFELYDLRVEVVAPPGAKLLCNSVAGDYFEVRGELLHFPQGKGFSLYNLAAIIPMLPAKQRPTDKNDWMTTDADIACPDPNCPSRFRITRLGKRRFSHAETTAVPLPKD